MLTAAAVAIAGQFSLNKLYEKRIVRSKNHLLIFPIAVSAVSAAMFLCLNAFSLQATGFGVGMAACGAVISVLSAILGIVIVRVGQVSVYTMFMMLGGMLLPYLYGVLFLKEALSPFCIAGLAALAAALALSAFGKGGGSGAKPKKIFYLLCAAAFLLNGGIGIVSKAHQISASALPTYDFLIWNYLFQFVLSGIAFGAYALFAAHRRKRAEADGASAGAQGEAEIATERRKRGLYAFLIVAAYAVVSGGGFLLQLLAAIKLPASMQYPFVTGGSVILTTLAAALFFREKITLKGYISLILMLAGTVLFVF